MDYTTSSRIPPWWTFLIIGSPERSVPRSAIWPSGPPYRYSTSMATPTWSLAAGPYLFISNSGIIPSMSGKTTGIIASQFIRLEPLFPILQFFSLSFFFLFIFFYFLILWILFFFFTSFLDFLYFYFLFLFFAYFPFFWLILFFFFSCFFSLFLTKRPSIILFSIQGGKATSGGIASIL